MLQGDAEARPNLEALILQFRTTIHLQKQGNMEKGMEGGLDSVLEFLFPLVVLKFYDPLKPLSSHSSPSC